MDIYNTNSGNVGVGTSTPLYLLHAGKNMTEPTIAIENSGGTGGATFEMIDMASGADWKFKATLSGGFKIRDHANGLDVIVVEPNSEANSIYIRQDGNFGIGTSNPTNRLTVTGDIVATDSIMVGNGMLITGDFRGSALNGVINCGGANRNYTNTLSDIVNPDINFATGDEDLYIQDNLEVGTTGYKPGGGSWSTLSDARYKKNIEPFTDGLSRIMQIRPVSFQYNEKANVNNLDKRYVGILAQDMLAIAPYMVEERPIGQKVREIENGVDEIIEPGTLAYTFDPSALDYLIINAVQEQQHMIESQQQRIESLEQENEAIKAEMEKILSRLNSGKE
ncbi:MAG: tail fiber domain-containing protein [Bacteroidales bacterium]|nr:tail fiber domain-containing protein [Bacteroidales bacterium]